MCTHGRIGFLKKTLGHVKAGQKEEFRHIGKGTHGLIHPHGVIRRKFGHKEFNNRLLGQADPVNHLGNGKPGMHLVFPHCYEETADKGSVKSPVQCPGQQGINGLICLY